MQVMPGLERAVEGLAVGGAVSFEMTPEDAFGELDPNLIVDVPLEAAPEGLEVGMAVRLQGGQTARVTAVRCRIPSSNW
jgi:FKBP-type peptidyl-prolyl cis-trans isomerase 2